jgi:hypothetical protein
MVFSNDMEGSMSGVCDMHGGKKETYRGLRLEKPEGKRPPRRHTLTLSIKLKRIFRRLLLLLLLLLLLTAMVLLEGGFADGMVTLPRKIKYS